MCTELVWVNKIIIIVQIVDVSSGARGIISYSSRNVQKSCETVEAEDRVQV